MRTQMEPTPKYELLEMMKMESLTATGTLQETVLFVSSCVD